MSYLDYKYFEEIEYKSALVVIIKEVAGNS